MAEPLRITVEFRRGEWHVRGIDEFEESVRTMGRLLYVLREQAKRLRSRAQSIEEPGSDAGP